MNIKINSLDVTVDTDGEEVLAADGRRELLHIQPRNGDVRVRFLMSTEGEDAGDVAPVLIVSGRLYPFEVKVPTNAVWIEATAAEVDVTILSASRV